MKRLHADRLHKLIDAVRVGVPNLKWNFGLWRKVNCKTTACALGHAPDVFPDSWMLEPSSENEFFPILKKSSTYDPEGDAAWFFGISEDEVEVLFTSMRPGSVSRRCSRETWCRHAEKFLTAKGFDRRSA